MLTKLTTSNDQTYGECQWGPGVTHTAPGAGGLCTAGWLHGYDDCDKVPGLLAVLLNPLHGNFTNPHLWQIEISGERKDDHGLKFGAMSMTTIKRLRLPRVSRECKITFAILCATAVTPRNTAWGRKWHKWANRWLNRKDRTRKSAAWAAEAAAEAAARAWEAAARAAAAWSAAWAAEAAAEAAEAAAKADIDLKAIALKAWRLTR
jgi:hypothetical protein